MYHAVITPILLTHAFATSLTLKWMRKKINKSSFEAFTPSFFQGKSPGNEKWQLRCPSRMSQGMVRKSFQLPELTCLSSKNRLGIILILQEIPDKDRKKLLEKHGILISSGMGLLGWEKQEYPAVITPGLVKPHLKVGIFPQNWWGKDAIPKLLGIFHLQFGESR